jgi:hypothetical protein
VWAHPEDHSAAEHSERLEDFQNDERYRSPFRERVSQLAVGEIGHDAPSPGKHNETVAQAAENHANVPLGKQQGELAGKRAAPLD